MTNYARTGAWALTLALALSFSTTRIAQADAGAGAFRLGADVPVMGLSHFPDAGLDTNFHFGLWDTTPLSTISPYPFIGLHAGYQLTDAMVIGARLGFGVSINELGFGGDATNGSFTLLPSFEYMFLDGSIRPFVGAQAGFQLYFPDGGDTQAWFIGGPMGGIHIFADEGFSISPTLYMDFLYRGADERAGFDLVLAVTFQGWIGGSGSQPRASQAPRNTTAETFP